MIDWNRNIRALAPLLLAGTMALVGCSDAEREVQQTDSEVLKEEPVRLAEPEPASTPPEAAPVVLSPAPAGSIRYPGTADTLLEFVNLRAIRDGRDPGEFTVRYGALLDPERFQVRLNDHDVTKRFSPAPGSEEMLQLSLQPGINRLEVMVAPVGPPERPLHREEVRVRVMASTPQVRATSGTMDRETADRMKGLMQRMRSDPEAAAEYRQLLRELSGN